MVAFSLVLIASALLKSNRIGFGLRIAADAFIVPFLGYYVARRFVTSEDHLRQLIRVIGCMGAYLIIIGFIERLMNPGIWYRLKGPFGSTNVLYVIMAVVFFVVLLDSVRSVNVAGEKQVLGWGLRWFLLCLAPVIILLGFTRGDWLGFLMGIGAFLFLGRRLINPARRLGAIGLALILISLVVMAAPALTPKEIVGGRIGSLDNFYGRLATWGLAIQEGVTHPLFGIGLNNLRGVLAGKSAQFATAQSYTTVHNSFLALFIEQGAVGLLAYLAVVGSIMRMGLTLHWTGPRSRDRWRGIVIVAIMIAYLVPALFGQTLHLIQLSHLYVYSVVGGIAGLHGVRQSVAHLHPSPTKGRMQRQLIGDVR